MKWWYVMFIHCVLKVDFNDSAAGNLGPWSADRSFGAWRFTGPSWKLWATGTGIHHGRKSWRLFSHQSFGTRRFWKWFLKGNCVCVFGCVFIFFNGGWWLLLVLVVVLGPSFLYGCERCKTITSYRRLGWLQAGRCLARGHDKMCSIVHEWNLQH